MDKLAIDAMNRGWALGFGTMVTRPEREAGLSMVDGTPPLPRRVRWPRDITLSWTIGAYSFALQARRAH